MEGPIPPAPFPAREGGDSDDGSTALVPIDGGAVTVRGGAREPARVAHVAGTNRRYPGEPVTFYTQVEAVRALAGVRVQISVPPELTLKDYTASLSHGEAPPEVVVRDGYRYVVWEAGRRLAAGEVLEYETTATVRPTQENLEIESEARVSLTGRDEPLTETAAILVAAQGRYLAHLPRVYQEQDELMGRFLMLFESFWAPIESQIDGIHYYLDPEFTPTELLPWLATWVDLSLDDRWPEEKRRKLLRAAVGLYRKRGTRAGLQEYLEIYTGARVQISEHGANNFTLGPEARLGPGVALGTINMPHTFTVTVFLNTEALRGADGGRADRVRSESEARRMIETIIEAEKPAHTSYQLRFQAV